MSNKQYFFLVITGMLYIWIMSALPYGIMLGAGHDDGWFIRRAMDILHGDWFGPYNQMTLIKGPVYPLFLSLTSVLGVSLQFSTAFCHLITTYLVIYSLSEYLKSFFSKYIVLVLLLISQFPLQRVIRDEVSLILLLLIISLTVIVFFNEKARYKNIISAFLGVLIGLMMLTREDGGLTSIPVIMFAIILSLMKFYARNNFKKIMISVSILIIFTIAVNVSYKLVNYLKYNSYVGVELLDSDYNDTLSAIYSVRESPIQRHVEVTNDNIDAIYRISPTFRSLESLIRLSAEWRESGCLLDKSTCGQFGVGYFMWMLRDVMYLKGYYSSPETAKINYRQITAEIRMACEAGKIKCANKYLSKIPAYELFNFKELIAIINNGIKASLHIPKYNIVIFNADNDGSEAPAKLLNISNYILPESNEIFYEIKGWYYDKTSSNSWFNVKVSNAGNTSDILDKAPSNKTVAVMEDLTMGALFLERQPSPDIASNFHDSNAMVQRFKFYVSCVRVGCILSVNEEVIGDIRHGILSKGYNAKGIFYVDSISGISKKYLNLTVIDQQASATNKYNLFAKLYNQCSSMLFATGIISFLTLLLIEFKRRKLDISTLIVTILWFTYFWRIIFVSLISFFWLPTGINQLYLYTSIVIMPLASFMSIYVAYNILVKDFFIKTCNRIKTKFLLFR